MKLFYLDVISMFTFKKIINATCICFDTTLNLDLTN